MRESSEAFQLLDRSLRARRAAVIRFSAGDLQQAFLIPLSVLVSQSQRQVVQVQGIEGSSKDASILFVASSDVAGEIESLLTAVMEQSPAWVAIPDAPSSAVRIQGKVAQAAGRVLCRSKDQRDFSFALYPLATVKAAPKSIQPVKAKIPEPSQNLQQRGRWFQSRSRIR
jgi:hypothetical protein